MESEAPKTRPTDLAEKLGCSVPYASQLLSGARFPSIPRALAIFDATGLLLGPLVGASDAQIATLRQFAPEPSDEAKAA